MGSATRTGATANGDDRYDIAVETSIRAVGRPDVDFELLSLSATGFSGRPSAAFRISDRVIVHIPLAGDTAARVVTVGKSGVRGEFVRPIDASGIVADLNAV
jgi:hypothetical protein